MIRYMNTIQRVNLLNLTPSIKETIRSITKAIVEFGIIKEATEYIIKVITPNPHIFL